MSRSQHRPALRATKAGNRMARCHRPCAVLIETARIAVPQIVVATERGAREPDVGVRHLMQLHDRPARRLHQSPTVMLSNRPARGKAHQGGTRGQSGRRCAVCVRWLGRDERRQWFPAWAHTAKLAEPRDRSNGPTSPGESAALRAGTWPCPCALLQARMTNNTARSGWKVGFNNDSARRSPFRCKRGSAAKPLPIATSRTDRRSSTCHGRHRPTDDIASRHGLP